MENPLVRNLEERKEIIEKEKLDKKLIDELKKINKKNNNK